MPSRTPHSWGYKLQPFHLGFAKKFCSNPWPCSWNPNKPFSWRTNRAQNATQVFYFVNNWHDHLQKAPIGFTEAAGNFQKVNRGRAGKGRFRAGKHLHRALSASSPSRRRIARCGAKRARHQHMKATRASWRLFLAAKTAFTRWFCLRLMSRNAPSWRPK